MLDHKVYGFGTGNYRRIYMVLTDLDLKTWLKINTNTHTFHLLLLLTRGLQGDVVYLS
jgi:hypothetical protein